LGILITSSPETLRWLDIIKSSISKEIPSAEYNESTNWASFKNPATKRKFVYLQPFKKQMRLFTECARAQQALKDANEYLRMKGYSGSFKPRINMNDEENEY